jgi:phage terminase large subunit-like protein
VTKEQLQAWYIEHTTLDENYQFRNQDITENAMKSFYRLPIAHQNRVIAVCQKYELCSKDPASYVPVMRYRYLAQTNLFALCHLLEKYRDTSRKLYTFTDGTTHNTHEEICNEFFVRKDPTVLSFKAFAKSYIDKKERLLLVPRGGFKSSMDMADTIQWMICWPEVTVMILTGVLELAKNFVSEIKSHFELDDDGTEQINLFETKKLTKPKTNEDTIGQSMFQVLFPEHCIMKEDGKQYEFQTPAIAQSGTSASVSAAGIGQNLSGWHVGVLKLDDVVTNENSHTIDRIKEINRQVSINNAVLHPYGFFDKIGTWYDSDDTYGQDMKYIAKCMKTGEPIKKKVYLRAAWWPNAAAVAAGKIEEEMVEKDWDLWFNEEGQLTYDFLRGKKLEDPDGFAIKYLNDPTQAHRVKFPRELMVRRTIHSNMLPQEGMIVSTVDTAYSTKSWADYTVIMTALIYGGRFYIIDMKRGRYNEYELPQIIAANALQWKPKRICIEDSVGVKWLGKEVYREMEKLRLRVPIEFVPLGQGSKGNAKEQKAKPVLRYLGDERLLFANQCAGLEEIYNELEKFGTASGTHDDIVSALSILVEQFASYADMEGRMTSSLASFVPDQRTKEYYDQTYGGDTFSKVYTQRSWAAACDAANDPHTDVQDVMQAEQAASQFDTDPLADLF